MARQYIAHCRAEDRVYFKIIHLAPNNQKVVARQLAAGGKVRADHMAIAVVHCGDGGRYEVSGPTGSALQERVALFSSLHSDPQKLRTTLLAHDDDRQVACSVRGMEGCSAVRFRCVHIYIDRCFLTHK